MDGWLEFLYLFIFLQSTENAGFDNRMRWHQQMATAFPGVHIESWYTTLRKRHHLYWNAACLQQAKTLELIDIPSFKPTKSQYVVESPLHAMEASKLRLYDVTKRLFSSFLILFELAMRLLSAVIRFLVWLLPPFSLTCSRWSEVWTLAKPISNRPLFTPNEPLCRLASAFWTL